MAPTSVRPFSCCPKFCFYRYFLTLISLVDDQAVEDDGEGSGGASDAGAENPFVHLLPCYPSPALVFLQSTPSSLAGLGQPVS